MLWKINIKTKMSLVITFTCFLQSSYFSESYRCLSYFFFSFQSFLLFRFFLPECSIKTSSSCLSSSVLCQAEESMITVMHPLQIQAFSYRYCIHTPILYTLQNHFHIDTVWIFLSILSYHQITSDSILNVILSNIGCVPTCLCMSITCVKVLAEARQVVRSHGTKVSVCFAQLKIGSGNQFQFQAKEASVLNL